MNETTITKVFSTTDNNYNYRYSISKNKYTIFKDESPFTLLMENKYRKTENNYPINKI